MKIILNIPFLLFSLSSFGCGPYFPSAFLNGDDCTYEARSNLSYELSLIGEAYFPEVEKYCFKKSKLNNCEAEIKDATTASGLDGEQLEQVLELLRKDRDLIKSGVMSCYLPGRTWAREFKLYLDGVAEIKNDPKLLQPKAWLKLLNLPKEQRRFKTAWTLYMLGNLHVKNDYATASKYYEQLREEVSGGAVDSAGLAYASLKSEYLYAADLKSKLKAAVKCFHTYKILNVGDENIGSALLDASYIAGHLDLGNPQFWEYMEKDSLLCDIVFLLRPPFEGRNICGVKKRKDVLKKMDVKIAPRLAWQAFSKGKVELCKQYLALSPENSMIKLWLQAKFARRNHDYVESAKLLRKWLNLYEGRSDRYPLYFAERSFPDEINGCLGCVLVYQTDFVEALYAFFKAGSETDCFHVAERFLTTKQLMNFCLKHCPGKSARYPFYKDCTISESLRYLLARRLMRENRCVEALVFMPLEGKVHIKQYMKLMKVANDKNLEPNVRATAFYNAGKMMLYQGMEMIGSELGPDYSCWNGVYDYAGIDELWFEDMKHLEYDFSKDYENSAIKPNKRFHYRYVAGDLMLEAAKVAKDPNLKIAALYLVGDRLKGRDPKSADIYYKQICSYRPHPFAERVTQRRWFLKKEELPEGLSKELESTASLSLKDFAVLFEEPTKIQRVK